jgi:signal transduction histidine kinase
VNKTASNTPDSGARTAALFLSIFVFLGAGIIAVGTFSYKNYEQNFRTQAERQLLSVVELKVSELAQWRRERMGDGETFFNNPAFSERVSRFFSQPPDEEARQQLRQWLGKIQSYYQYERIVLLDARAVVRLTVPDRAESAADLSEHVAEATHSERVEFVDFHRHAPDQPVVLTVQVPIYDESGTNLLLGILLLEINPDTYLYPFIQRWPVPSETAETLLVRREGDEVVFVNALRFNTNSVLTVRASITKTELPAVQAALGQEGIFEGPDYRGRRVISALHAVPDSPWFMVARQDRKEVFAPVRQRLGLTVGMMGILLVGAGATVGLVWRQQRVRFYRQQAKTAEDLRISNRDLEQFAYIASHDLQEPLRMVANYMQLLERRYKDKLDQDARDFIGFAVDGAVRMQQLIDSLLDYSRLQTRKKPFEPVDLERVVQRVLCDLEGRILETGARITVKPLPHVTGDALQLSLVFQNLISNALKFRAEKSPEIHIAAEEFSNHWKITVRDNGIGIEPEHQERIFKIFQRLHSRAEYPGTGIGLAICRRIIERHGGETGVESEIGKGSTFWFTLPKKGES